MLDGGAVHGHAGGARTRQGESGETRRSSRRILLIVPRPLRDLEGHALVAYYLEERYGHEVLFHTGPGAGERMLEEAPDAVVLDYLGCDERAQQARLASRLGIKVVVLPTAGTYEQAAGHERSAGKETGTADLIDCYLAWGELSRRIVVEGTTVDAGKVHTVGCPRFDLYSQPYLSLMGERETFLRRLDLQDPGSPLILWATNTNHFSYGWDVAVRRAARGTVPEAEIRMLLEDERNQFEEHSRVVLALASRHPSWNFVIKVHPLEPVESYRSMAAATPNVRLAFDAPIREFLYQCDILLQRGCTTATEAWMLGKPVLELAMGRFATHWVSPDYLLGSHRVGDLDDADDTIRRYLSGMPVPEEQRRARAAYLADAYFRVDGHSSERCAAQIDRVVSPPLRSNQHQARSQELARVAYQVHHEREARRPVNRLKDALGIQRDSSIRFWTKLGRSRDARSATDDASFLMTAERTAELYRRYDEVLAGGTRET
jgi:surface carbohydrate biosynthesis protein